METAEDTVTESLAMTNLLDSAEFPVAYVTKPRSPRKGTSSALLGS
jgi:hypothetical protein